MDLSVLIKAGLCAFILLCFLPGKKLILFIAKLGQVVALTVKWTIFRNRLVLNTSRFFSSEDRLKKKLNFFH